MTQDKVDIATLTPEAPVEQFGDQWLSIERNFLLILILNLIFYRN